MLGTLIIFYPTLYSLASVAGVLPQILLIPFFVSFISALFLEEFYSEGRVQFSKPANKLARILFPALGSLSLLGISLLWTWGFHPNLAGTYTYFFLITVALVASAGLLTFLAYLLNLGNIRRVLSLTADLQKSSSELDLLKSQINPHFLFNSLNTLYGIALEEEGLKTADGIQKLSDMMRFMLEENTTDKIPLSREIDYIHNYIDLQSLRLARSNDMALNINIDEACEGEITPMLIIPFIENAFKHGISLQQESWIKIHLSCSSQALNLTIKNTNHAKKDSMTKESGIGIENVRKRLAILYPNAHTLDIQSNEKVYEVLLKLPLT
ncbi:MAG: histidine kinase [Roseivirga sp.]